MKTTIKIALYVLLFVFVIANLTGIFFDVNSFGTFISFLIVFTALGWALFLFLLKKCVISKNTYSNFLTLIFSTAFILLICEIYLRLFTTNLTSYMERNGSLIYHTSYQIYLHSCDSCKGGKYYINEPNGQRHLDKPEFNYIHTYNSLGLRDVEFKIQKDSSEYRILGIGDSFTEGVGTSQDSTWLKQLENILTLDSSTDKHITTMNAGAQGSDLFFGYDLYKNCLLKYKPDLIILSLNSTDINDIVYRGGYERYDAHGKFVGKKGPWWEFVFGSSYVARLILLNGLHYNWQLLSESEQKNLENEIYSQIYNKLTDYQNLATEEGSDFLLVTYPLHVEFEDSNSFVHRLKVPSSVYHIDLTTVLRQAIDTSSVEKYYWPVDGHFTSLGYQLKAKIIYENYFMNRENAE